MSLHVNEYLYEKRGCYVGAHYARAQGTVERCVRASTTTAESRSELRPGPLSLYPTIILVSLTHSTDNFWLLLFTYVQRPLLLSGFSSNELY